MGPRSRATLTVIVSLFLNLSCGGWTSVEAQTPTITLYTTRRQVPNANPTARTIYPDGYYSLSPTVGPPRGTPQVIIGDNEVRAARDLTSPSSERFACTGLLASPLLPRTGRMLSDSSISSTRTPFPLAE
ncbi:hypothetical protein R1flu_021495 [Riccia fluitans]|uniref:Uncharacterized protein n=1 Tax=Riccia fluitans TaxID=41844 RepID=A0ABD1ZQ32_9MARC